MKNTILVALALAGLSSCVKLPEEKEKAYNCLCTYIPITGGPSEGQANKNETSTVYGTDLDEADIRCKQQQSKYAGQYFSGNCLIQ